MQVTVIIPSRGDRPEFLKHLRSNILPSQTRQPDEVLIIDRPPLTSENDHKQRIREGILQASGDLILFMEDDDYYRKDYIEVMTDRWNGEDLIGIDGTLYYNIVHDKWRFMKHHRRSSLFCTGIKREAAEKFPFKGKDIDIDLWRNLEGTLYPFDGLAIGIKHGIGKTGGIGHREDFCNNEGGKLHKWVDEVSHDFYYSFKK